MSYLAAAPDLIAAAAIDAASIGAAVTEAHTAAAAQTVTLVPAAADEVSTAAAQLFSGYAHEFQEVSAQASAFHEQFVQHLKATAGSYAGAEAANAASFHFLNSIELIERLAPSARRRLNRLDDTQLRLAHLHLPTPLVHFLLGSYLIAVLPYFLALGLIVLSSEGSFP